MFAVIFEVCAKPERRDGYLALAGVLRPEVEAIEGFISNERFASRSRPGWLLSLSLWRDEAALIRWRLHARHRTAQALGRSEMFADYRLRVGEVVAEDAQPQGKLATVLEQPGDAPPPAAIDGDVFASITQPGHAVALHSWSGHAAAARWRAALPEGAKLRTVRIIRDYGMFSRAEAPTG